MSKLSDIKLTFLQGDYSNCLWYITKQNCNFRDLAMMARILEMWNDDPNESFQSYFDRIKKTPPFSDYINNSPHRALKNCEFYGLMTPSGSRAAYSSNNLTDVYRAVKELCNSDFANIETYQEAINSQLEKMNISVNNQEINPIMYALKVLIVLGDATGIYKINNKEFKLFVCTCNEWKQFFQSVESIIRYRTDSEFQQAASANYNIANDTRFNLVFDNLSYLSNEGNAISIKDDCIEEVRRKVAEYELGASIQTSGSSTLHVPATIAESSNTLLQSYLTAIRTKPFILLAGISAMRETVNPLLGQPPEKELVDDIVRLVKCDERILGIHDLVVHDYGPGRLMISLHAEVPYKEDILELHDLIDQIEFSLRRELHCEAVIHMDPIVDDDALIKEAKAEVARIISELDGDVLFHDFRMVKGPTHSNLIFDVVVPHGYPLSDDELKNLIQDKIREFNSTYFCVIHIDKAFV